MWVEQNTWSDNYLDEVGRGHILDCPVDSTLIGVAVHEESVMNIGKANIDFAFS